MSKAWAQQVDIEQGGDRISLVQLAARQRPIPEWEDSQRKRILLILSVSGCVLLITAIMYSRLCPCFSSVHEKAEEWFAATKQP